MLPHSTALVVWRWVTYLRHPAGIWRALCCWVVVGKVGGSRYFVPATSLKVVGIFLRGTFEACKCRGYGFVLPCMYHAMCLLYVFIASLVSGLLLDGVAIFGAFFGQYRRHRAEGNARHFSGAVVVRGFQPISWRVFVDSCAWV